MFDSIDEIKIMTEPDSETKLSTCILWYRYLIGARSRICLFLLLLSYRRQIDYLRQIYRPTRHSTLYNGTGPVYPHQRTGACKCHVIAAVLSRRVQKLTPAELRPFCHTKREDYNGDLVVLISLILSCQILTKTQI